MKRNSNSVVYGVDDIGACFDELDLYKGEIERHVMMDVFIAHDSLIRRRLQP